MSRLLGIAVRTASPAPVAEAEAARVLTTGTIRANDRVDLRPRETTGQA